MMNIYEKLDALYDMAVTEQENGTAKLAEAGVSYDDGTIQGVMEHIPTEGGSGGEGFFLYSDLLFQSVRLINDDVRIS